MQHLILRDDIILRDERHYLGSDACFYRDSRRAETVYLAPAAFGLLVYLTDAHTREEAWSFYRDEGARQGEQPDIGEFGGFLDELTLAGVLEEGPPGACHARPRSNLRLRPPEAPVLPMTFPARVNVTLTMRCNLTCGHCLRESSPSSAVNAELDTSEVTALLEDLDRNGAISIALSGGEPTTRRDIVDILGAAGGLRSHVEFFTNGHLIRPEVLEALQAVQERKAQGFYVHLSLDGARAKSHDWLRGRGSFDRVVRALETLRAAGVRTVVESCLTPENLGELDALVDLCWQHRVEGLAVHPISATGRGGCDSFALPLPAVHRAAREVTALQQEYEGRLRVEFDYRFTPAPSNRGWETFALPPNTTGAGMFHMAIGSDGRVYPCTESVGVASLVMGDVRREDTEAVWASPRWLFFRGGWQLADLKGCRGCVFDGNCASQACRCYAAASTGDLYSPFPDCYANQDALWQEDVACPA